MTENAAQSETGGTADETRAGVVALLGAPNAGKSTLVNALVGEKVAIVSPKAQTTRVRLTGIVVEGQSQLLLIDTPGLFQPRRRLDRAMVEDAWLGVGDADHVLFVLDAREGLTDAIRATLTRLAASSKPRWLVLNKSDLVGAKALSALQQEVAAILPFAESFALSALKGTGVDGLRQALAAAAPVGPWLFPEDQMSDAPARLMAAELVREQLFRQLGAELPYQSAVHIEKYTEHKKNPTVIHAQILVERPGQKAIVIGRQGARIKTIGEAARHQIEALLGKRVHLFLHVKVQPDWGNSHAVWRDLGLKWTA